MGMREKGLLQNGRPLFGLSCYAVSKDGRYAGACAYEGTDYAICDEKGPRVEKMAYLFKASENPAK